MAPMSRSKSRTTWSASSRQPMPRAADTRIMSSSTSVTLRTLRTG